MSVDSSGVQSGGGTAPRISSDGRFVVFQSSASDLVPGDANGWSDVFVHDRISAQTTLVSVDSNGFQGNFISYDGSITADGRYVVFTSQASNLVPGDAGSFADVFVRDLQTGQTVRVSVDSNGVQGNANSDSPSISDDGRYVVFRSSASNLVPNDMNQSTDVFLHDLQTGQTSLVSIALTGGVGSSNSSYPKISPDGRFVVFDSAASDLVQNDQNNGGDVFVRDLQTGHTELATLDSSGIQANASTPASTSSLSGDGRYVAFSSPASNLVPVDTNARSDIFVHDRLTGHTERVSIDSIGLEGDNHSTLEAISADGRYVAFRSYADNLVPNDTNGQADVFVHDRQTGLTERVSVDSNGVEGNGSELLLAISGDGRFVAFDSSSSNLVPGDTNGAQDVFVRDRGPGYSSIQFCFGDGTASACPCGNAGSAGHGCANSLFAQGAGLHGGGNASVTADTFILTATGMPNSTVLYFQGSAQANSGLGAAFGDGLRCAGGTVIRLGEKLNASNGSAYPGGGDAPISFKGAIPASGGLRTYQAWYRNAAGSCGSGFNLTNGVQVDWAP